ncbi:hypothetical protein ACFX13_041298 [Malus domestica]
MVLGRGVGWRGGRVGVGVGVSGIAASVAVATSIVTESSESKHFSCNPDSSHRTTTKIDTILCPPALKSVSLRRFLPSPTLVSFNDLKNTSSRAPPWLRGWEEQAEEDDFFRFSFFIL